MSSDALHLSKYAPQLKTNQEPLCTEVESNSDTENPSNEEK
jgi:hypothetical protein